MTIHRVKLIVILVFAAALVTAATLHRTPTALSAAGEDPAVTFKAKCAMCHTVKAEKFFDPTKAEDLLVDVVLKGKKAEKPPHMPGFEAKGMNADEAKGLVNYMKGLRTPAS